MTSGQTRLSTIADLTARLLPMARPDDVVLVAVSGFAGAGKTTLCRSLQAARPNLVSHFVCDRFSRHSFHEREQRIAEQASRARGGEEENPRTWYDWQAIERALGALRGDRSFAFERAWNTASGELDARYKLDLRSDGPAIVLCDGIFLLHDAVRHWFDATILVDCPEPVRRARGRRRSNDPARLAYMNELERRFAEPYFRENAAHAQIVYAPSGPPEE